MKILILGHRGMLGNAARKYFYGKGYDIEVILDEDLRWDFEEFRNRVEDSNAEYIINAIGAIPQKKYDWNYYVSLNVELPLYLDSLNKKIIHPSSDCEFSGNLPPTHRYRKTHKRDAEDDYGRSKALASILLEDLSSNTKMIRTSIIGHEIKSGVSILDWFLSQENEVNGYTNHHWNGVTTLYWCELAEKIILNWDDYDVVTQVGTEGGPKGDLLKLFGKIYGKSTIINNFEIAKTNNKMLVSDFEVPSIEEQIIQLKEFYNK